MVGAHTVPAQSSETVHSRCREAQRESCLLRNFTAPPGILFQASLDGSTPEAQENVALAWLLAQTQIPVQLAPLETRGGPDHVASSSGHQHLESLTLQRVDLVRSVLYQACSPDRWTLDFYARSRVGRAAFATDRIPDGWADRCKAMDEVWVPTEFHREIFAACGIDSRKVRVLHTGIDTRLFRPDLPPLEIPHLRGFNFLSLSDWRARQGTDVLLRAYVQEFKPDEDVALILKISECENSSVDIEAELLSFIEIQLKRRLENIPRVILLSGGSVYPQDDFARLCASAHAFVYPCRAEALGRALLEALSGGLPVIATRWGGPLEFLDDDNSFLIGMEGLVPALPEEEHFAGHRWAEPSIDHLRELMREVFSSGEEARKRGEQGRRDAVERWDWSVVVPQWTEAFRRLLA